MSRTARPSQPQGRQPYAIDHALLTVLLVHMVRHPAVFQALRERISPAMFNGADERHYAIIWSETLALWDLGRALPGREMLAAAVTSRLANDPFTDPAAAEKVFETIDYFWADWPEAALNEACALEFAKDFLQARTVTQPLERALSDVRVTGSTLDVESLLDSLRGPRSIVAGITSATDDNSVVPEVWHREQAAPKPIGVPILDERMGGGMRPGEVAVIIGPTGGGKTLLAIEALVAHARRTQMDLEAGTGEPTVNYYFSFEGSLGELRCRVLSCAAEIQLDRMLATKQWSDLSTAANLNPYEQTRFAARIREGGIVVGERERFEAVNAWLNPRIKLADFSGSTEHSPVPRGNGGVTEIENYVHERFHREGVKPGLVIVDYALSCARKHVTATGGDLEKKLRLELTAFVERVYTGITAPYGANALVLQQLGGEHCVKPPGAELHHSMAAECRTFAERAWFAFWLGNKDTRTNTCLVGASKTRLAAPMPPAICYVDGAFGRMVDSSHEFVIEGRQIVRRSHHDAVVTATAQATQAAPARGYDPESGNDSF
jgi:hypothetical protein